MASRGERTFFSTPKFLSSEVFQQLILHQCVVRQAVSGDRSVCVAVGTDHIITFWLVVIDDTVFNSEFRLKAGVH